MGKDDKKKTAVTPSPREIEKIRREREQVVKGNKPVQK